MAFNQDNFPRDMVELIVRFLGDIVPLCYVSKYLRLVVSEKFKILLLWSKKTYCRTVAKNGLLELMKWARDNGCDWK